MLSLVRKKINSGSNTIQAVSNTIQEIIGTVATAILFNDRPEFVLATNNGSLYTLTDNKDLIVFASERFIIEKLLNKSILKSKKEKFIIEQLESNTGLLINSETFEITHFDIIANNNVSTSTQTYSTEYEIDEINIENNQVLRSVVLDIETIGFNFNSSTEREFLEYNIDRISNLKRCTKCLLPETFPFIEFDEKGVCNVCNNYNPKINPNVLMN